MTVPSWAPAAHPARAAAGSPTPGSLTLDHAPGASPLMTGMSSRLVRLFCVLALTLSTASALLAPDVSLANAQADTLVATTALNLRARPTTSSAVLTVIPSGGSVSVTGASQSGFLPVTYNGLAGFAYGDYLRGGSAPSAGNSGSTPGASGSARTTTDLNLRSGAGTSFVVLLVIPAGAAVQLAGTQQNGFAQVTYGGTQGWASSTYLTGGGSTSVPTTPTTPSTPSDGGTTSGAAGSATVNGSLNLRASASTSAQVLTVMPGGASLQVLGPRQNGFAQVGYNGTTGWAFEQYLTLGGTSAPSVAATTAPATTAPVTTTPSTGTGTGPTTQLWATTTINVRSGPGTTYPVLTVMPAGASGTGTGQAQNGFWSIDYNGTRGWVSSGLVSQNGGGGAVDPAPTAPSGASGSYTQDQIIQIIYAAADRYGQPRADMLRVARCESVLDPRAVNAGGRSYGLFQFIPSTWATTPYASYDIFDPWASANAAGWMWQNGRRNEWVCQ